MCSPISVLSHKKARKYAQVPRATWGVSCYAFYSTGKRNITQRGTVAQYGSKEFISVTYRTERLRNISCRRSCAIPKRLASLLAAVGIARQLQVHRNLRNYKPVVNFNVITFRIKVKREVLW